MQKWRRVRDTETGAEYSVTTEQVGSTWEELPEEPSADVYGNPLPTKTRVQLAAEEVAERSAYAAADSIDDVNTPFDPGSAHVADVLTYLEGVDEAERSRVVAAEAAGKNRATITGWQPA